MVGNKRLAIIARMDDSGLGHQTRNLVRVLNPDKVIAIDFSFYNKFKQHPEWYKDYNTTYINGFLQDDDVRKIMNEADIVLTAETFYNNRFIDIAELYGVKTINQINYEFFDPLANRNLLIPSVVAMPSYWHLQDMSRQTQRCIYLPPPIFLEDFSEVRKVNRERTGKKRFLHVAGKMATHDRAGTKSLLDSLKYSTEDFELVIKVQSGEQLNTVDPRVTFDYTSLDDERELYRGFDAMVQPRRYAGLNLPMNEALAAGLPVIMTDISPNNQVLPSEWLVKSFNNGSFFARTNIELFSAFPQSLGAKLDEFSQLEESQLKEHKVRAYNIALAEYSVEKFLERWALLLSKLGVK
jgi:glycosyltransferase involved in cell wall biosynthesis